jgi:hypothetical protein
VPIQNFPASLQPIIQQNFLEREFHDALESIIGYRKIARREPFSAGIGETLTKTRAGLKAPTTTPLVPNTNTNLDNGLTPSTWTQEQYTLSIAMYGDAIDLNTVTNRVGIVEQFLQNAKVNGIQSAQSLDRLARNAIYAPYLGGNTWVRATLGAPAATLQVDDVRGFQTVIVNGQVVPVSGGNPMQVQVGATNYSLTGFTIDGGNVSKAIAAGGISGTLTFSGNVSVADATLGNAPVLATRPSSCARTAAAIRPPSWAAT